MYRKERKKSLEIEKSKRKERTTRLKDLNKRIREDNNLQGAKSTKRKRRHGWGLNQKKFHHKHKERISVQYMKQRLSHSEERRRRDAGGSNFDRTKIMKEAKQKKRLAVAFKLKGLRQISLKKALTERKINELLEFRRRKKKRNHLSNKKKVHKEKRKKRRKRLKTKNSLAYFNSKGKMMRVSKSKKRVKPKKMIKSKSSIDLGDTLKRRFISYLKDSDDIKGVDHQEFERLYKNYKKMVNGNQNNHRKQRVSAKPTVPSKYNSGEKKAKQMEDRFNQLKLKFDQKIQKNMRKAKIQKKSVEHRNIASKANSQKKGMEKDLEEKQRKLSPSSSEIEENDISNLSEKFRILNGAATCIQKTYRGYITRKKWKLFKEEIYQDMLEMMTEKDSDKHLFEEEEGEMSNNSEQINKNIKIHQFEKERPKSVKYSRDFEKVIITPNGKKRKSKNDQIVEKQQNFRNEAKEYSREKLSDIILTNEQNLNDKQEIESDSELLMNRTDQEELLSKEDIWASELKSSKNDDPPRKSLQRDKSKVQLIQNNQNKDTKVNKMFPETNKVLSEASKVLSEANKVSDANKEVSEPKPNTDNDVSQSSEKRPQDKQITIKNKEVPEKLNKVDPMESNGIQNIIGNYQNFANKQLENWNEIISMVEKLKDTKEVDVRIAIDKTLKKMQSTSQLNINIVKKNLKEIEIISQNPSTICLKKKEPIKPTFNLDIHKVNNTFNMNSFDPKNLSNNSRNKSPLNGTQTPSQSKSHRKSIEKWIDPNQEMLEKKNIDLVRGLIEPEGMSSNRSSHQIISNNEFKSFTSVASNEENNGFNSLKNFEKNPNAAVLEGEKKSSYESETGTIKIMQDLEIQPKDFAIDVKEKENLVSSNSEREISLGIEFDLKQPIDEPEEKAKIFEIFDSESEETYPKTQEYDDQNSVDNLHQEVKLKFERFETEKEAKSLEDIPNFGKEEEGLEEDYFDEFDQNNHIKSKKADILTHEILNFLLDELMMDGFVLRELIKLQGEMPKGIKTNINSVKGYLSSLIEFIQNKYKDGVIHQVNNPLGPTPEERLRLFHAVSDDDNLDSSYAKINYEQVLDIDIYFEFEDKLMNEGDRLNFDPFQVEVEHIHNKLLFDCLNESLDSFRVYGLKGMPLPLKNCGRIDRVIQEKHIPGILVNSSHRVIEWSTFMCGFIPFKDDSFIQVPHFLDEDTLTQIKEDRLVRLLTDEALEDDNKWLNFEDEEIEVEIELADVIFDHLISDTLECLLTIKHNKETTVTS